MIKKIFKNLLISTFILSLMLGLSSLSIKSNKTNNQYSYAAELSLSELENKLNIEKNKLLNEKSRLMSSGVTYSPFAKYTDGDKYTLMLIVNVLDPSFDYWKFNEYKTHHITSEYCSIKQQIEDYNNPKPSYPNSEIRDISTNTIKKKTSNVSSIIIISSATVFILTTCVIIAVIFEKNKIKGFEKNTDNSANKDSFNNSSNNSESGEKLKKCAYCGSLLKKDATECDSCGGKEFKKHKH